MSLLLDTNAVLWSIFEPERIRTSTREAITAPDETVFVSAVCAWEIAIKLALRRLAAPPNVRAWLPRAMAFSRLVELPITFEHAFGVEQLPLHHADPFDRLLIAQAAVERLTIVTNDARFEPYGVPLLRC